MTHMSIKIAKICYTGDTDKSTADIKPHGQKPRAEKPRGQEPRGQKLLRTKAPCLKFTADKNPQR